MKTFFRSLNHGRESFASNGIYFTFIKNQEHALSGMKHFALSVSVKL